MFQSAVKTAKGVSAFKNWTPFWGTGRMESLHTDCQPVSEYEIWYKNWIQNVLLNIVDRLVNCCLIIYFGRRMNLGLFSTHSVIIYNTLLPFSSPSFYYKLNLKLIFHHLQRTKLSLGTVFNLNLDNPVILQK